MMGDMLLLLIVPVGGLIIGALVWFMGRRIGRREAETSRDLSEHQQAAKGRQAAADERRRTAGFDPQHLTLEIDERTDAWRAR